MTHRTVRAFVAVITLGSVSVLTAAASFAGRTGSPTEEVFIFVLVEADSFLCSPCLGRVLDFCREAGRCRNRVHLGAIVLLQPPKTSDKREPYRLMVARRALSVFRANGLALPIVVDEAGRWEPYASQGMDLVILDGKTHSVRGLSLPLEPDILEAILQAQTQGGNFHE